MNGHEARDDMNGHVPTAAAGHAGRARHRRAPTAGTSTLRRWGGIPVALAVLVGATLTWQASRAAFSGTTSNTGDAFTAGTVTITDNDAGSAMFTLGAMKPGDTAIVCMGVKYTGSVTPSAIKLYTSGAQETTDGGTTWVAYAHDSAADTDNNLNMEILVNNSDLAADPGSSCAPGGVGTFADVAAAAPGTNMETMINSYTTFANGLASGWGTITANKWRVFKFIYTFAAAAPNTAQNSGVKLNFVWEADS